MHEADVSHMVSDEQRLAYQTLLLVAHRAYIILEAISVDCSLILGISNVSSPALSNTLPYQKSFMKLVHLPQF